MTHFLHLLNPYKRYQIVSSQIYDLMAAIIIQTTTAIVIKKENIYT